MKKSLELSLIHFLWGFVYPVALLELVSVLIMQIPFGWDQLLYFYLMERAITLLIPMIFRIQLQLIGQVPFLAYSDSAMLLLYHLTLQNFKVRISLVFNILPMEEQHRVIFVKPYKLLSLFYSLSLINWKSAIPSQLLSFLKISFS